MFSKDFQPQGKNINSAKQMKAKFRESSKLCAKSKNEAFGVSSSPVPDSSPSPFSLRITAEERRQLKQAAGEMPIGAYVRSRLFGHELIAARRQVARPVKEQQDLAQLLAELGKARLANNLNQLAKAVNSGSLPVCDETTRDIKEAYENVLWMRQTLISALGLKSECLKPERTSHKDKKDFGGPA